jgi:hypothetical protein
MTRSERFQKVKEAIEARQLSREVMKAIIYEVTADVLEESSTGLTVVLGAMDINVATEIIRVDIMAETTADESFIAVGRVTLKENSLIIDSYNTPHNLIVSVCEENALEKAKEAVDGIVEVYRNMGRDDEVE